MPPPPVARRWLPLFSQADLLRVDLHRELRHKLLQLRVLLLEAALLLRVGNGHPAEALAPPRHRLQAHADLAGDLADLRSTLDLSDSPDDLRLGKLALSSHREPLLYATKSMGQISGVRSPRSR